MRQRYAIIIQIQHSCLLRAIGMAYVLMGMAVRRIEADNRMPFTPNARPVLNTELDNSPSCTLQMDNDLVVRRKYDLEVLLEFWPLEFHSRFADQCNTEVAFPQRRGPVRACCHLQQALIGRPAQPDATSDRP